MTRGWGAFGAVALAVVGCRSSGPAFESVAELPAEPRRPAGTEMELHVTLPQESRTGETRDGLVLLEAPADPARARAAVAGFFRAIVEESPSALEAVLAPQALIQSASRREAARSNWLGRFARLDYRSLSGETLYRDADLELWEPRKSGDPPSNAPLEPTGEELVARVSVTATFAGRQRLIGDEFVFRLVPAGSGFAISEIVEEFRAP